jgi:hypothetical protein
MCVAVAVADSSLADRRGDVGRIHQSTNPPPALHMFSRLRASLSRILDVTGQ